MRADWTLVLIPQDASPIRSHSVVPLDTYPCTIVHHTKSTVTEASSANGLIIGVEASTGESLAVNNPDWNPTARPALTWDGGVSRVDRTDVRQVSVVTEICDQDARANRTDLLQGIEGGLHIPNELPVYQTMAHGLVTINYVTQMHVYLVYGHGVSWYAD